MPKTPDFKQNKDFSDFLRKKNIPLPETGWNYAGPSEEHGVNFKNGWTNSEDGSPASWYLTEDGQVRLRGKVESGDSNSVIFTLPEEVRPEFTERFIIPDGSVHLDNLGFRAFSGGTGIPPACPSYTTSVFLAKHVASSGKVVTDYLLEELPFTYSTDYLDVYDITTQADVPEGSWVEFFVIGGEGIINGGDFDGVRKGVVATYNGLWYVEFPQTNCFLGSFPPRFPTGGGLHFGADLAGGSDSSEGVGKFAYHAYSFDGYTTTPFVANNVFPYSQRTKLTKLTSDMPAGTNLPVTFVNSTDTDFGYERTDVVFQDFIIVGIAFTHNKDIRFDNDNPDNGYAEEEDVWTDFPAPNYTDDTQLASSLTTTYEGDDREDGFNLFMLGCIFWNDASQDPTITEDNWSPITTYKYSGDRDLCLAIVAQDVTDAVDRPLTVTFDSETGCGLKIPGYDIPPC